jgi:transporter family protein
MGWFGYALLSAVFAGLVAILGKIGVRDIDATTATAARAAVMFAVLAAVVIARGTGAAVGALAGRAGVFVVLSGLAGAASWICYFRALQLGDALRVAPIDRLSGAVTLILAVALLDERAPLSAWLGTALMLIGALIVARS